jgi:NhaA family Na+:H+ antiporter
VLALLGKRAPTSLKLFLTTVAIVDDMGAVAIIALAYTPSINTLSRWASRPASSSSCTRWARAACEALDLSDRRLLLWYAVLLSGVHATIAGVLAAATDPDRPTPGAPDAPDSPLHRLEHARAWVASSSCRCSASPMPACRSPAWASSELFAPLPLGIAAGLFLGKQLGIFGAVWLRSGSASPPSCAARPGCRSTRSPAVRHRLHDEPVHRRARLSRRQPELIEEAKIGVLLGSFLSAHRSATCILRLRARPPAAAGRGEPAIGGDRRRRRRRGAWRNATMKIFGVDARCCCSPAACRSAGRRPATAWTRSPRTMSR